MFCDENSTVGQHCFDNKFLTACRCVHRIKLELNSNVELIIVNVDDKIAHPIHLHGHKFHILGEILKLHTLVPNKIQC